jgi:quercetin dioxygenase-like cupin family protein
MLQGQINIDITEQDLESIEFHDYSQCYQQLPEIKEYYNKHNSSIWQKFEDSPGWVHALSKIIPQDFTHHEVSVIKLPPGQTIPYHRDKHYLLQKNYGVGETWRYLIFLEDWKPGHYFEYAQEPVVKWQAGEYIKIYPGVLHHSSNSGSLPKYTCQITGTEVFK